MCNDNGPLVCKRHTLITRPLQCQNMIRNSHYIPTVSLCLRVQHSQCGTRWLDHLLNISQLTINKIGPITKVLLTKLRHNFGTFKKLPKIMKYFQIYSNKLSKIIKYFQIFVKVVKFRQIWSYCNIGNGS